MRTSRNTSFLAKIIAGVALAILAVSAFSVIYMVSQPHLFTKMTKVMTANYFFWVILLSGATYGLFVKLKNPTEFTWLELPLQLFVGGLSLMGAFGTFVFWSGGLYDTEFWNGNVTESAYFESWVEVSEDCDDDGNCTDTYTNHGPEWVLYTTTGHTVSIAEAEYKRLKTRFGGSRYVDIYRMNEAYYSNGNKYVTTWDENSQTLVPSSVEERYVNFLKASQSTQLRQGLTEAHRPNLKPYPTLQKGQFGRIEVDRVINAGTTASDMWIDALDRRLDRVLARLGGEKQVNLLVYLVDSGDRGFLHALEEEWIFGKKNDVVLVIGSTNFPTVDWAGVMIFAGNEALKIELRNTIEDSDISDPDQVADAFIGHIEKSFQRVPMAELEYLLYDIRIPWWAYLIVFLLNSVVVLFTSALLLNNRVRSR